MKYVELVQNIDIYAIDKLNEKLNHYKGAISRWAYIVHDKDINKIGEPRKPHFHCAIEFNEKTYTFARIAKMFEIEEQYIQKTKKKGLIGFNNLLSYLVHSTDNANQKIQYDPRLVKSNFNYEDALKVIQSEISDTSSHEERVNKIIRDYANFKLTKKQLFSALSFSDYNKNIKAITNATKYRNETSRNGERDMQVIYICGSAGSGKTTLAKFLSTSSGFDYFISGSGKDLLDGYDNEESIILDDLRAESFTKAELFKLLDNNTGSGVKSRYYNKVINKCRLMFITSVKEPMLLYNWLGESQEEPIKQFTRRLGFHYLSIEKDKIYEVHIDENGEYDRKDLWVYDMPFIKSYLGFKDSDDKLSALLDRVHKKVREDLEKQSNDLPF